MKGLIKGILTKKKSTKKTTKQETKAQKAKAQNKAKSTKKANKISKMLGKQGGNSSGSPKTEHESFQDKVKKVQNLPHPDANTISQVHDLLQSRFVKLFNKAKVNQKAYYTALKTVTTNPVFRGIKTYKNLPMAKSVMNEVVGFGVVSEIAREHPNVTDIVFNGRFLTYETSNHKYRYGQQPGEDATLLTPDYINQLVNKFTNNAENHKSVNPTQPIFDGMYKDMRISVCYGGHDGLTPIDYDSTFEIRVTKANLPLNVHNFTSFAPMFILSRVFDPMVKAKASFMISGETGTAKTSLQKLIIGCIQQRYRIVMIEDTPEMHLNKIYPDKDVLDWITSDISHTGIADLVEESLRADPEWVMVAEVRDGKSAYQMFQSLKTGHAIMTTLHAKDNKSVASRFAGMIRESMNVPEGPLEHDFRDYMDLGVHLSAKIIGGRIFRYLDQLAEFVPKSKEHPDGLNVLFNQELINVHGVAYRRWRTYPASQKIKDTIRRNWTIKNFTMPYTKDIKHDKNGQVVYGLVDKHGNFKHNEVGNVELATAKTYKDKQPCRPLPDDHYEKVPLNLKYNG